MTKFVSLLCFLLIAGGSSYAAQPWYGIKVFFENKCAYPVELNITGFSNRNEVSMNEVVSKSAASSEKIQVLGVANLTHEIQLVVPDNYKLEIIRGDASDKKITLDRAGFIEAVEKGEYYEKSCGLFCSSRTYLGTISNPSLCP